MAGILFMSRRTRSQILRRSREIASALTRHGLGWLMVRVGLGGFVPFERGWFGHEARQTPYTQAEHLRMALSELGGAFIKLGQALSTRPDFVPPEYVVELSKLQDSAPPVPFDDICQVFCDELGQLPEKIFDEFNPQPLASASIGQVHTGKLKNGQSVIVKIQRPDVAGQIEEDLEILFGMAEWAESHTAFGRDYNLPALVDEFSFTLRNELDYQREGQNADRFRRNFAGDPSISIPRVYWEFTTDRVLTLQRVGGIKVADMSALDAAGIDRHIVAENSVRIMLREVFEFGFFHADPHPGNFFVQHDGSIAMIDFGMVGRLDTNMMESLLRIGMAVGRQDAERITDEFFAIGMANADVKRKALQRDLDHFISRYAGRSIKDLAATKTVDEVMAIALRHHLQMPAELVMLFRVVGISEGLGAQLDPSFKLFEFAAPYFQQFWLQHRSPKAIALRVGQTALDAAELGLTLPQHISRLIGQVERGELELNVNHEGLRDFAHRLQQMVNRLALALLLAATIVALGFMMIVYHPPFWDIYGGWLFGLGFLLALGLGAWMMWMIWRSGRG
ncbi:MAG: AarF/ABC1/UbiB kinase family protein [Chloroflexi bacterium]|nr:AarF/ABC1/UbiB kinase family protein [Chloroflexota bacterium]